MEPATAKWLVSQTLSRHKPIRHGDAEIPEGGSILSNTSAGSHQPQGGPTWRDVTDRIAALGPFFAVDTHQPGAIPIPPWRPLLDLVEQPDLMMSRIDAVRTALAAGRPVQHIEHRVAASVAHLGLVARLIAPALAFVVATGHPPCTDLSSLWWQDKLGGAFPLSVPDDITPVPDITSVPDITQATSTHQPTDTVHRAALLHEKLIHGPVQALTDAVAARVPVSALVLQGNIASAINSAATLIGSNRVDLLHPSQAIADALLHDPELNPANSPSGETFRRSSCCLIYRASPSRSASRGSICGDCVLTPSRHR